MHCSLSNSALPYCMNSQKVRSSHDATYTVLCKFESAAWTIWQLSSSILIVVPQSRGGPDGVTMVSSSAIQSASTAALGLVAGFLIRRRCDLA